MGSAIDLLHHRFLVCLSLALDLCKLVKDLLEELVLVLVLVHDGLQLSYMFFSLQEVLLYARERFLVLQLPHNGRLEEFLNQLANSGLQREPIKVIHCTRIHSFFVRVVHFKCFPSLN